MSHFAFNTWNHCPQGRIIVEDITKIMGHQMMALGHEVSWSNESFIDGDGAYNVVLESFADDPATLATIAAAHANGCRFIIVATEEPTPNGFNHGLEPAMVDRQNAFPAAAKFADGILHLIPGTEVTRWYSQFGIPAAYAELGFAPTLLRNRDYVEPDHDFGFYGKMTWRREQMLGHLESTGAKVLRLTSLDVPRDARDNLMQHAKIIVQIRANDEWGMVSSTRCASALCFGRPVVAEPHPYSKPWDEIVPFSTSVAAFYRDAAKALRWWRAMHTTQLAKFAEKLTPEICIGAPLRQIGIT